MSLLAGIIGSAGKAPNLNTSITTQTQRSNTTSGMTITGANSGQLYILCHDAYNSSGISAAPATPTGFTSLSSYAQSGSIFSFRLSYKILTSNEATFTLPSVSGANGQQAIGLVIDTLSGSFTGLSLENSLGYSYLNDDEVSATLSANVNTILIGYVALYPAGGAGGGTLLPSPSAFVNTISGGPSFGDYSISLKAKNYTTSANDTWTEGRIGATTLLTNTFALKPTFSV